MATWNAVRQQRKRQNDIPLSVVIERLLQQNLSCRFHSFVGYSALATIPLYALLCNGFSGLWVLSLFLQLSITKTRFFKRYFLHFRCKRITPLRNSQRNVYRDIGLVFPFFVFWVPFMRDKKEPCGSCWTKLILIDFSVKNGYTISLESGWRDA